VGFQLFLIAQFVLSMGCGLRFCLSVISLPSSFQHVAKGSVDLLLVKPISPVCCCLQFVGPHVYSLNAFCGRGHLVSARASVRAFGKLVLLLIPIHFLLRYSLFCFDLMAC